MGKGTPTASGYRTRNPPQDEGNDDSFYSLLPLTASPKLGDHHRWRKVFPVDFFSKIGVNLTEAVFEISDEDAFSKYSCTQLHDTNSHQNFPHLNSVECFSPYLWMVQQKDGGERRSIFFTMLCTCEFCNRKVDTLRLKPITRNITFEVLNDEKKKSIALTFYPGVTDRYNMKTEANLCQAGHVIYYSNFIKQSTGELIPLKRFTSARCTMDYSKVEPDAWTPPEIVFSRIVPVEDFPSRFVRKETIMKTNLEFESSDGKFIRCHQCVLSCESSKLWEMLRKEDKIGEGECVKWNVSEPAAAVEALLVFVYWTNTKRLESSSFETCCGVFKLACNYQMMELMGAISMVLTRKLENVRWKNVVRVQKLMNFLQTVGRIQILVLLKQRVCLTLIRLLRKHGISRIRWSVVDPTNVLLALLDTLGRHTQQKERSDGVVQELIRVINQNEM